MKSNSEKEKSKQATVMIVIPDECGDTLWDEVLAQSSYAQLTKKATKEKIKN